MKDIFEKRRLISAFDGDPQNAVAQVGAAAVSGGDGEYELDWRFVAEADCFVVSGTAADADAESGGLN